MTNIGKKNRVTILGYGEEKLDKAEFDNFKGTIDEKIAEATDNNEVLGAINNKVADLETLKIDKTTFNTFSSTVDKKVEIVTAQLAETVKKNEVRLKTEKISSSDVSDELRNQITGNAPINTIPEKNSVVQSKLSIPLQEMLIKSFVWELGSVLSDGNLSVSSTRIRTPISELKAGTSITLSDTTDFKYALHRFKYSDKSYIGQTGWITAPTTITEDVFGILIVAKTNDANLSQVIEETGNKLLVYGNQSVNALKVKVENSVQEVSAFKTVFDSSQLASKNISPNGSFKNNLTGWTTVASVATVTSGELKLTATGADGRIYAPISFNANDVIYRTGLIKTTSNKVGIGGSSVLFKPHSGSGKYERVSDSRMYNQYYMSIVDTRTSGWDDIYAKNLLAINLTQTFGKGKEPTAAEMDKLINKFPDGWFESGVNNPLLDFKEVYFKLRDLSKPKNPFDSFIKAITHRGYSSIAPENTLPSYKLAKEKGFSYVECDVIFSADGVGMISHLDDLTACTNGTGLISESNLSYLKTLDAGSWKSAEYAGTQIPTFEEFITLCKRLSLHPYIEIKKATTQQIGLLVNQCKLKGMLKNVTWIGALEFIRTVLASDESARIGWVASSENATDANISTLVSLKNGKNKVFINLDQATLTKELTEKCINQGLEVETWTVNNEQKVITLSGWGVTGISTDGLNIAEILAT